MATEVTRVSRFRVAAIAAGEMVPAGCCPVPAAAAAVQILMFMDGVEDVVVDEATGELAVTHRPDQVAATDLADELTFIGLPAEAL
jgi:hypothetical protein